jgi:glycosyltransferase involved in cell wall biosynthesis
MRVLVLTPYLPHRRVGHGGGTAVRDLLAWLARRHEVTAACLIRPGEADLVDDVRALGVAVEPLLFADRAAAGTARAPLLRDRAAAAGRALVSGYPFYVEKYWTPALAAHLRTVVDRCRPEVVQVEYLQLSLHCRDLRRFRAEPQPRLILNTHELGSLPRERRARLASNPLARFLAAAEATRWRRLQVAACGWADRTLCVTPQDRDLLAAMGGTRLSTVPLGMDLEAIRADWAPAPDTCRFLFVGSFGHAPNRSGARLLLDEIWPRVHSARPDARLDLVGRGSEAFIADRGGSAYWSERGVTALGYVDDLGPVFRRCCAFAAPLTEGGGIKIKVLEALARGVPVVTTAVGAEGIASADQAALEVAPADAGFADALLRVAADRSLATQLGQGGRRLMEERFGWAAITEQLSRIYAGEPA